MTNTPHYVLKVQYTSKPAETRNFDAPVVTLGREAGDVVLGDPQASGRHAEIHFQNGAISVKDLGSTNGTYFNGARTPQFAMAPGQAFSIGQTVITLLAVHGPPARGQAKTMIAMGPPPPAPGARPGGPPPPGPAGRPPPPGPAGRPPPPGPAARPPSGPAPGAPPPGAPPQQAAPPPGAPMGPPMGQPPAGPPPGQAPMGQAPMGPPPGQPPMGPPPGQPPMGQPPGQPPMGPPPGQPMGAPMPAPVGPPASMSGPAPMASMAGSGIRPTFMGTGGEIFGQLFVGGLLTAITFGIYLPWFYCKLINYVFSKTAVSGTAKGSLRLSFTGKGGELFVTFLVGYLLTAITFGIYLPWFVAKLTKWAYDNTNFVADDGTQYKLRFDATGGDLLVTFLVGGFLTMITFYIYLPWFLCKVYKLIFTKTIIIENGQPVGNMDFVGEGGKLFGTLIVGAILTAITFYIYYPWFLVKLNKFYAQHTRINVKGKSYNMAFNGTGGELFVIALIAGLLIPITLGIYIFWYIAKVLNFMINNLTVHELGAAPAMAMPPGPGAQPAFQGQPQGMMGPGPGQPQPGLPPQQQPGLPPQQPGYPPQGGGYPPQGGPPPGGGYPPQGGGYPPPQ